MASIKGNFQGLESKIPLARASCQVVALTLLVVVRGAWVGTATRRKEKAFDINDFDETLPAPWEWDVKRLATHARAGQPALIAGYLGKGDQFDEAVADLATAYAEQNERDYQTMLRAVRQGRIKVYTES